MRHPPRPQEANLVPVLRAYRPKDRRVPLSPAAGAVFSVSEDEAAELALGLDVEQAGGSVGSYRYKIYPRPEGGYRIVFLDSAVRRNAVTRVVLLSLLLGSVS